MEIAPSAPSSSLALLEEHADLDLLSLVASHLDLPALGNLGSVDVFYRDALSEHTNDIWEAICSETFAGKVHIAPEVIQLRANGRAREALKLALIDSRREALTEAELTSFDWCFRFKAAAGPGWLEDDPYWQGSEPARVEFNGAGGISARGFPMLEQRRLRWTWALGRGPFGSHVQLTVDGARVPTYVVSRHPSNWGWLMQSCWVLYTSFDMPPKGSDPSLEDAALDVTVETQHREAHAYNAGINFASWGAFLPSDEEDDEEDEEPDDGENGGGTSGYHPLGGGGGGGGGSSSSGVSNGPTVTLQLANGETMNVPMWVLQQLEHAQEEARQGGGAAGGEEESGPPHPMMATDGTADTGDAEEEEDDVDEEDEDAWSVDVEDVLRSRGGLR